MMENYAMRDCFLFYFILLFEMIYSMNGIHGCGGKPNTGKNYGLKVHKITIKRKHILCRLQSCPPFSRGKTTHWQQYVQLYGYDAKILGQNFKT